jgi:ArsR family transcriptional regulator
MQRLDLITTNPDLCCAPPGAGMLDRESAERQAVVFKALADPVRVQLLSHLAAACCSTVCACHLPELVGISQPTLSHHLKKLTEAGLIRKQMRGRWANFTINPDGFAAAADLLSALGVHSPAEPA